MTCKSPLVFETALAELLLAELRRQGVSRSSECAGAILQRVEVEHSSDGLTASATARLALGGLGLADREGIAVAEALLKLGSPSMLKTHGVDCWVLLVNDNALTDRSAAHLSLLASRCAPPLVLLDARGNAMTAKGMRRIEEARAMSPSLRVLLLSSEVTDKTMRETLRAKGQSAASATSCGSASRCGVDMEALRRRCCTLFASGDRTSEAAGESCIAAAVGSAEKSSRANGRESVVNTTSDTSPVAVGDSQRSKVLLALAGQSAVASKPPTGNGEMRRSNSSEKMRSQKETAGPIFQNDTDTSPTLEELVDVTANLDPVLKSVLDLSNTVPSGRLQTLYGVDNIWDVIGTHSDAASKLHFDKSVSTFSKVVASGITFQSLTVLNIRENGLTSLEVLPSSLLRLDVSGNELRALSGLEKCKMLTLLNAQHNRLQSMTGLERNLALSHLFLGHNAITFVEGIAHLLVLETLDLAHNRLKTQSSIRPLSLSKGLRHVILRGNPVMERMKHSYRPLLRNLCPSLVSIDGDRLTFSKFAEKAQKESDYQRLLYALETGNNSGNALKGEKGAVSTDAVNSANYMHLLTRGVTVEEDSGYSNAARTARVARALQRRAAAAVESKERQRRQRQNGGRGGRASLREELLKRLAGESKKFLESVLEERLSKLHASCVTKTAAGGCEPGREKGETTAEKGRAITSPAHGTENGREGGLTNSRGSGEDNSHAVTEPTQCTSLSGFDSAGNHGGFQLMQCRSNYSAVHRDMTLDHEEWLQLREKKGPRRAPFGDTPCRLSPRPTTPHDDHRKCQENVLPVSPIRRHVDDSNLISGNATQILRDVDMLEFQTRDDGVLSSRSKLKSSLMETTPRRPMLLSPSANSSPVRGYRIDLSNQSRRRSKPVTSPSLLFPTNKTLKKKNPRFSPPPPLTLSVAADTRATRDLVHAWVMQLHEDARAVQDALHAIVSLLDMQRQCLTRSRRSLFSPPFAFLEERKQCVDILKESGMLLDTEVPVNVVEYYNFTPEELNCTSEEEEGDCEEHKDQLASKYASTDGDEQFEKREVLRSIRLLSDGKTCLRYLALLIEERREKPLHQYVDELFEFMVCE